MKGLREIVSYVLPIQVEARSSIHNPVLEVSLSNGRYVLDAESSNYSFGALYTIFKNAFRDIEIQSKKFTNCLLLGVGGGSVIYLLQRKYNFTMPVTAVEIDPLVIELGRKYFHLDQYKNLTLVIDDAYDFSKKCSGSFDLIIVDLYINDEVPDKFHTAEFISSLKKMAHSSTIILFNKMLSSKRAKQGYSALVTEMTKAFNSVNLLTYKVNNVTNTIICVNSGPGR